MYFLEAFKRNHYLVAFFFFTVLFSVYFNSVLLSLNAFPADGYLADFHAKLELWTNYFFSGYPIYAAPDKQYGYPIRLLFTFFPKVIGFNLFVISAYILASFFTYGYVYHLTKSKFSAYASGIVFGLSGFMLAHLIHTSMIHVAAWLPLILWSLSQLRQGYSGFWFCIGSTSVAMSILSGHPQITVYSLLLAGSYVLLFGSSAVDGRNKYFLVSLSVVILGLALSAFQVLPMLELTELSLRQLMTYERFKSYTLPISQIAQLFSAFIFGGFKGEGYSGAYNFHELTGYVGLLTWLLALVGVTTNKGNKDVAFWFAVATVSLMLAFGNATPFFRLFYEIPVVNLFRAHARIFVIFSFAIAVLVGFGIYSLQKKVVSMKLRRRIVIASSSFLLLVLLLTMMLMKNSGSVLSVLPALVSLLIAVFVILRWNSPIQSTAGCILVLFILFMDLASTSSYFAWKFHVTPSSFLEPSRLHVSYKKKLDENHHRFAALDGFWSNTLTPDQARLYDIQTVGGYEQLELKRYKMLSRIGASGSVVGSVVNET